MVGAERFTPWVRLTRFGVGHGTRHERSNEPHDGASRSAPWCTGCREQIPDLVRSEMRLAQAELTEKGKSAGLGVGMFSAAGLRRCSGSPTLHRDRGRWRSTWCCRLGGRPDRGRRPLRWARPSPASLVRRRSRPRPRPRPRRPSPTSSEDIATVREATHEHRVPATPEQIEADIERQRDELAATVDDLQAKLDVKTRVKDKATELDDRATTATEAAAVSRRAPWPRSRSLAGCIVLRVRRSR